MNESSQVSRRRFVAQAGLAAAAAPYIVSARALGREDRAAASDRLTLGFIGMGKQNLGHLGRYVSRPEVQVVAVCDRNFADDTESGDADLEEIHFCLERDPETTFRSI